MGIAQVKWHSWVRKQRLTDRLPEDFGTVLDDVLTFAGPAVNPATRPARAGMAFGRVRRSWAAEHHRAWHNDLEQTARSPR